jgi:hypothetical protein
MHKCTVARRGGLVEWWYLASKHTDGELHFGTISLVAAGLCRPYSSREQALGTVAETTKLIDGRSAVVLLGTVLWQARHCLLLFTNGFFRDLSGPVTLRSSSYVGNMKQQQACRI